MLLWSDAFEEGRKVSFVKKQDEDERLQRETPKE